VRDLLRKYEEFLTEPEGILPMGANKNRVMRHLALHAFILPILKSAILHIMAGGGH
jgi:hypothetical protein